MKYFKDINTNDVYAYEVDGSQDHLISELLVPINYEEALVISNTSTTEEVLLLNMVNTIQYHLDSKAREYRYDNIHTACGWAGEFTDATALKSWAASCWRVAGEVELAVMTKTRPIPSSEELISELPLFILP